ncbi:MAG: hypothetical protein IJC12_02900 [Peptococcaceae bacterium]|nr:hypothetical protein [Peptococcaceae bacterium]
MSNILCVLFGFFPLLIGVIMNYALQVSNYMLALPYTLIGIVLLGIWCAAAYIFNKKIRNPYKVMLLLNLIPFLDFLLICVQLFVYDQFWFNIVGIWSLTFYLPLTRLGALIVRLLPLPYITTFPIKLISFMLLLIASFIGCKCLKNTRENVL